MKVLALFVFLMSCSISSIAHCQEIQRDSSKVIKLHLGLNFGFLTAGGTAGGGGIKLAPRIGVHLNKKFVLGLEANSDYQTVYVKDSLMYPSIRASKWIGPFFRYNVFSPTNKWNMCLTANYIFGSYYQWTQQEIFRTTYNTLFLGLGASYQLKNFSIDAGYRYTFLLNNTPIQANWTNTIFLGLSRNF